MITINIFYGIIVIVAYSFVVIVYAKMTCYQDELSETEVLICPDSDNIDLSYCCLNNGLVSCCSYDDYYERHFGPSAGTIAALIISHILLVIMAIYWCKKNFHRQRTNEYV
ncbi:uncharacterized protein LOC142320932 [Lycorma delicatula]|uniref:uncharacterized protein LOC142320932 n=1 Tax=Lycorma delicatula TaxID=130591 RepID=UPI003F5134DE